MPEAKLYCGTSGFAYPSWKPGFYPEKLASSKFLTYYASHLNTVEVNYTYRRLASEATFKKWVAVTPSGFLFLPKAHMKLTHVLKLRETDEFLKVFLDSLEPLAAAGRLGPILFQLPPGFKADPALLAEFLSCVPRSIKTTWEFRNATWFTDRVYETLQSAGASLCLAENENLETPHVLTADFVYLRLRKPDYTASEIIGITDRVSKYLNNGYPTWAIFKHEETPAGALNAEELLRSMTTMAAQTA